MIQTGMNVGIPLSAEDPPAPEEGPVTSPPPPDSHPTGPPTGPLSGPPGAPSGRPSQGHEPTQVGKPWEPQRQPSRPGPPGGPRGPRGGGGGGGGGAGGGQPWWRSAPRVAIIAAIVVAAVIAAVVLTRPGGGGQTEVFAEPAASVGQNPVTRSTANTSTASPSPTPVKAGSSNAKTEISGSTAGLYGGTQHNAACDVEKQITYLQSAPSRNQAFAGVLGVSPGGVPAYLRSLTPVQLGYDTRVTNHGYKDGKAYEFQSVLQAGTAVMVDPYGVPRVRCKCGNPLTTPKQVHGMKVVGDKWAGFQPNKAVVVEPAPTKVKEFTLRNPKTGEWFKRPEGANGPAADTPTAPPAKTPSGPASSQPPPYGSTPPGASPPAPPTPRLREPAARVPRAAPAPPHRRRGRANRAPPAGPPPVGPPAPPEAPHPAAGPRRAAAPPPAVAPPRAVTPRRAAVPPPAGPTPVGPTPVVRPPADRPARPRAESHHRRRDRRTGPVTVRKGTRRGGCPSDIELCPDYPVRRTTSTADRPSAYAAGATAGFEGFAPHGARARHCQPFCFGGIPCTPHSAATPPGSYPS
ncbi:DUF6777 domain-containing protein [Streptomyces sp. MOE7]|uniref:DUF6777 domain-containing protein n=1 Tax=Streptomyces sp. MOE7 TaxID=1961713 RepID=UPI0030147CFE